MYSRRLKDLTFIKILGTDDNRKIKVVRMKSVQNAGFETEKKYIPEETLHYDHKLEESISRAKTKIFEIAFCNSWDFFLTATLDPAKYDRTDLERFHKDFTKWLSNQGQKYKTKIDFLLIPEKHSDGQSWHIHGLLRGVPLSALHQFTKGDIMGKKLAEKVLNGDVVYNWIDYQRKFGFCDLEPIRSPEAVSKYVTKYICKDLAKSVSEVGAHLYYHSRGLKTAETIKKGMMSANITPDFENEFVQIVECPYSDENLSNWLSLLY